MSTRQELFDKAVGGLIEQGECAATVTNGSIQCRYRLNKNGRILCCIVGQVIPDDIAEKYDDRVFGVDMWDMDDVEKYLDGNYQFWSEMQDIHDSNSDAPFEKVIEEFRKHATRYNLEWNFD